MSFKIRLKEMKELREVLKVSLVSKLLRLEMKTSRILVNAFQSNFKFSL